VEKKKSFYGSVNRVDGRIALQVFCPRPNPGGWTRLERKKRGVRLQLMSVTISSLGERGTRFLEILNRGSRSKEKRKRGRQTRPRLAREGFNLSQQKIPALSRDSGKGKSHDAPNTKR